MALPTLQVEGGILMGATGVDVGGTLYDVRFMDGTCAALFSGCNDLTDVPFPDFPTTQSASQALLDQVFTGPYNNPELTNGCTEPRGCYVLTPTIFLGQGNFDGIGFLAAVNNKLGIGDFISQYAFVNFADTANHSTVTWAQWTPAQAVPEPSTVLLLTSGLLGLAGYEWRQRRQSGLQVR